MSDFDYRRCPRCGSLSTCRGYGLYGNRCRRCDQCLRSYDPDDERAKWQAAEAERLALVTHRE